jgi:hypothetical protein
VLTASRFGDAEFRFQVGNPEIKSGSERSRTLNSHSGGSRRERLGDAVEALRGLVVQPDRRRCHHHDITYTSHFDAMQYLIVRPVVFRVCALVVVGASASCGSSNKSDSTSINDNTGTETCIQNADCLSPLVCAHIDPGPDEGMCVFPLAKSSAYPDACSNDSRISAYSNDSINLERSCVRACNADSRCPSLFTCFANVCLPTSWKPYFCAVYSHANGCTE